MWRIAVLLFTIGFIPLNVLAWGVNTHFAITKVAAKDAENLKYFLETFGLQNGLPKEDCEVDAHPSTRRFNGYDVDPENMRNEDGSDKTGFLALANNLRYDGKLELTYTPNRQVIVGCT